MFGSEEHHREAQLSCRRDVHVLHQEGSWIVTTAGTDETYFQTLAEAEDYGRQIAVRERSKFFVHSEDGQVVSKECYEQQVLEGVA